MSAWRRVLEQTTSALLRQSGTDELAAKDAVTAPDKSRMVAPSDV